MTTVSGTEVDFTGLPSPTRITVAFKNVSTNGVSDMLVQLGNGSYQNAGYGGGGTNYVTAAASTAGILVNAYAASGIISGLLELVLADAAANLWVASGTFYDAGNNSAGMTGGHVTLSGPVERLRVTTVNGTDQFDAGTIDIVYE